MIDTNPTQGQMTNTNIKFIIKSIDRSFNLPGYTREIRM